MTTTYRASGAELVVPSAAVAYTSSELYLINGVPGVAKATYAIGDRALFVTEGVHTLDLAAAAAAVAGELAYFDAALGELTDDVSLPVVGTFYNASTGAKAELKLNDFGAGGSTMAVISIDDTDSPYTLAVTDRDVFINADTQSGVITINLPAAASWTGRRVTIKRAGTGINAITVDPNAAETIDGGATDATMDAQYDVMEITSDGTDVLIVNSTIA